MIQRFLKFITQNNLIKPTDKVLLTVSGGIDSVVLAHLFYETKLNFAIAHCNFQLRGNDSDLDETFVSQLADKYGVEFYSTKFDTEKYQHENKISIQMAARELRYKWFNEIVEKHHFDLIATAHHANDQAETIIFNLTKGTGLKGVRGMKVKNANLIRPLLFATRTEIEIYRANCNLTWREDVSNSVTKYKRNAIRHLVIPELQKLNPNFIASVNQFSDKMVDLEKLLNEQVLQWKNKIVKKENNVVYIDLKQLEQLEYKSLILYEILKEFDFDNIEEILTARNAISGKSFYSKTAHLVVDREQLVIVLINANNNIYIEIDSETKEVNTAIGKFNISQTQNCSYQNIEKCNNIAYLDMDKLTFPLVLRTWHEGDIIKPLGMNGKSKKISDILIDAKVPLNLKKNILVLQVNNEIVWLAGFVFSEKFKIQKMVANCLVIRLDKI